MRFLPRLLVAFVLFSSVAMGQEDGWQLVWQDEFSYTGLPDPAKWDYDSGGAGWGNNELQFYTARNPENCHVANGRLIIEAIKETVGENNYTSARLVTRGKAMWQYGRIEVRAKVPEGRGTWPAIWLLRPLWPLKMPDDGEIDIMETVGYQPCMVHGTIHCASYNQALKNERTASIFVPLCSQRFHIYSLEWSKEMITMAVDGEEYFVFRNDHRGEKSWPFDKPYYLLLNLAIGGDWGGADGIDDAAFPQRMEVDYVRVYQKK